MKHAGTRIVAVTAISTILLALSSSATASAANEQLGWLRLSPAQGTTSDAVDALTEKPCPGGTAVVVDVEGPGVPAEGDIGFLVGNTALTALKPTESGQVYVPLSLTFRDWFARNAPSVTPKGTYTITLTCRDALRASLTYGSYSGRVSIAANGSYRALGEAGLPFDTVLRNGDPLPGDGEGTPGEPTSSASAEPSGSGSKAPSAGPSESSTPSTATGSSGSDPSPGPSSDDPSLQAAEAAGAPSGGIPPALLGLGALLIAAAGFLIMRSRNGGGATPTTARHSSDS